MSVAPSLFDSAAGRYREFYLSHVTSQPPPFLHVLTAHQSYRHGTMEVKPAISVGDVVMAMDDTVEVREFPAVHVLGRY